MSTSGLGFKCVYPAALAALVSGTNAGVTFIGIRVTGGRGHLFLLPLLVCCYFAGCVSSPIASTHRDIVDLAPLSENAFEAPYDPRLGVIRVSMAEVEVAVPVVGRSREFARVTRSELTDLFSRSPNFQVASRSAVAETRAEWDLVAHGAADPTTVPASSGIVLPQYLLKATVTQVDRNIIGKGGDMILPTGPVTIGLSGERREGGVVIQMEVIDLATSVVVFTARGNGRLMDSRRSARGLFQGIGGGQSRTTRVPESQAIREACEGIMREVHGYFSGAASIGLAGDSSQVRANQRTSQ